MVPPDRLINAASPQLRAFQARAPLLTPQQRLPSAMIAAGLGVFSSQSMVDLYSAIYDSTDPGDLADTDAWQLRQAFVGKDADTRLAAIRKLLGDRQGRAAEGSGAGAGRPRGDACRARCQARQGRAGPDLGDARRRLRPGGGALDRRRSTDGRRGCRPLLGDAGAWRARTSPTSARGRINSFIRRDKSRDKVRSALLVAGLAGLGRISADTANSLNRRYGLGLGHVTSWTQDDRRRRGARARRARCWC